MTKAEIIENVSENTGLERNAVQNSLEAFMDCIKNSVEKGENVYLRGFGSFCVKKRAKKTARNISKNKTVVIPAHHIPSFKPSRDFIENVRGNVPVMA